MRSLAYTLLVFLLLPFCSFSQNNAKLDSLLNILKQHTEDDTNKVKTLLRVGYAYNDIDFKIGIEYCKKAIELSEKLNYDMGVASGYAKIGLLYRFNDDARVALEYHIKALKIYQAQNIVSLIADEYNNIGNCYDIMNEYDKAIDYFNSALQIRIKEKNKRAIAAIYNNIGNLHKNKGDYSLALEFQFKSLKIKEEIGDIGFIAGSYNNIGVTYRRLKNYSEAKKYFLKSLEIKEKLNDVRGIAQTLTNIGVVIVEADTTSVTNKKLALSYFIKAAAMRKKMNDIASLAQSMENIAVIYLGLNKMDSAKYYASEGLKHRIQSADEDGIAKSYANMFSIYRKTDGEKALKYLDEALRIAKKSYSKPLLEEIYEHYVSFYDERGEYKKALEYHKSFMTIKDSIYTTESSRQLAEISTKYETEKKEKENELLKKDAALKDSEIEKHATYNKFLYGVIALALLVIVIAFIAYRNKKRDNQILIEQKNQIEEQKKEIIDSIHYAKRIQTSLLPTEKYIDRNIKKLKG